MVLYSRNTRRNRMHSRQHNRSHGNIGKCPFAAEYIGNVFLLGLTTLAGELIDLQAANALDVLLKPFQNGQNDSESQEILAGNVQDTDVIDLLDGLI